MKDKTYKELESELSIILSNIDRSEHDDLQGLLDDFDKGQKIISELEKRIKAAELKVTKISKGNN